MKVPKILTIPVSLAVLSAAVLANHLTGLPPCHEFRPREDVLVVLASNFQLHLGWTLEGCDQPGAGGQRLD
jgi:hypothetical protein